MYIAHIIYSWRNPKKVYGVHWLIRKQCSIIVIYRLFTTNKIFCSDWLLISLLLRSTFCMLCYHQDYCEVGLSLWLCLHFTNEHKFHIFSLTLNVQILKNTSSLGQFDENFSRTYWMLPGIMHAKRSILWLYFSAQRSHFKNLVKCRIVHSVPDKIEIN